MDASQNYKNEAFVCPHCGVYANQRWYAACGQYYGPGGFAMSPVDFKDFQFSDCAHCRKQAIWYQENIVFPKPLLPEPPNQDVPDDIKDDYEETRSIFDLSPRGSSALLRLALQKLCVHLGESGKNINEDIKSLVEKGLPDRVQEALDSVRVIGNEAVHPGVMNLNDDRDTAKTLFKLINFIVSNMTTEKRYVDEIFNSLPSDKLQGIKDRDGN
jgi:predicted RNA-binding Zn-ribbon protein involved in translation (DUF1610 family)